MIQAEHSMNHLGMLHLKVQLEFVKEESFQS